MKEQIIKSHMNWKRWMLLVIISLVVSILGNLLLYSNNAENITKGMKGVFENPNGSFEINSSDIIYIGYSVQENKYISRSIDPQLLLPDIGKEIYEVEIIFSEPLEQSLTVQVYYTMGTEQLNEKQSIHKKVYEGDSSICIPFYGKYIQILRLDVGTEENVKFALENVKIKTCLTLAEWCNYFQIDAIYVNRVMLTTILLIFIGIHFFVNIINFYNYIFDKRWIVAAVILLFLVVNKYNGDSLSLYDNSIQTGIGSEYIKPIIGDARPVRTDEWVVSNPAKLGVLNSSGIFEKYNTATRGTETINASFNMHFGLSMLASKPWNMAYAILPLEYAYSFAWYVPIILSFMVSIEMGMILSNKNKLLSVLCGILLGCSPWYNWWGFPTYIISAQGCIVCANYYLFSDKTWKKVLCIAGLALSFSMFVTNLYPAWQVPIGYLFAAILIWFLAQNIEQIKKFGKEDIICISLMVIMSGILIIAYLFDIREYTAVIMDTVYPGERRNFGGGYLAKLFYYFQAVAYPFIEIGNASEASGVISLFPLPLIFALYVLIKKKGKDLFLICLCTVSILLTIYAIIPIPEWLANVSLLSYSIGARVADIVGWSMVYLLIRVLSYNEEMRRIPHEIGTTLIAGCIFIAFIFCQTSYSNYLPSKLSVILFVIYIIISMCLFITSNRRCLNKGIIVLAIIGMISGVTVRPLSKGLDSIYSKPVAQKIIEIVEQDSEGKWIATSNIPSGFLTACGAPTITFVNTYPNMELWSRLDKEKQYEHIYNRYAHVTLALTEEQTSFELLWLDSMKVNLSIDDIDDIGADYMFVLKPLETTTYENVYFEEIYAEYGAYIYKIKHL